MTKLPELYVPAITPFAEDLSVDTGRLVDHALALLEAGAHGLAPFGTTSEANSLSVAERIAGLEALIAGGIDPSRIIPGTGCAALPDTITLTRHAREAGCRGALMLPPFYYKGVPEAGVADVFSRAIEGAGAEGLSVYLYHIPQMSGVPITAGLIEVLTGRFGSVIAGLKDSSGDWENTRALIEAFPALDIYSASESLIPQNVATGGAGCISASANVNPAGIRALIDALGKDGEAAALAQVSTVRSIFEGLPLIPSIKAAVAVQRGDAGFARVRPPFVAADPGGEGVLKAVAAAQMGPPA
ncbi:dihydrodipicolinate synthase family protein [Pseudoroseicyclus sp. H15]